MSRHAERVPVSSGRGVGETFERLARLYDERGKPDEAARWRGVLAKPAATQTALPSATPPATHPATRPATRPAGAGRA
jgi:hypothetical protein